MEARFSLDSETVDQLALRLVEAIKPLLTSGALSPLLNIDQLAKFLSVDKGWIYDRTRNKQEGFPFVRVGKYLRFDLTEVVNWLRDQEK